MSCQHLDYDDYFGKCFDCGATIQDIHASECTGKVDEDTFCEYCGYFCHHVEEAA